MKTFTRACASITFIIAITVFGYTDPPKACVGILAAIYLRVTTIEGAEETLASLDRRGAKP